MKKLIITLFALLSIVAGVSSCDKDEQKTNDTTKEVNTDAIEYWLIEIDKCLELKDNADSGYPAESFTALESVRNELAALLSDNEAGKILDQESVDALAKKAEAAVKAFKDSYRYVARTAELYVPGADDTSNYIKLGEPGAFDSYSTISVSFWFKGADKMNYQRQGSIISNFISAGGQFYGWEINTWASNEQGDGSYRLRVSRAFNGALREPSNEYVEHNVWHHIAYTYNNDTHYTALYLDGKKIGDDTYDGAPIAPGYAVQMCAFKSLTDPGNPKAVSGSIKKLRFWDKALTPEEVTADVNAEVSGNEQGLIAAWDFNKTVEDPNNVMDKTGKHKAQVLGDKVEWRTIE